VADNHQILPEAGVVFWLWLAVVVIAVPPIAIGLALAMTFLYFQETYSGSFRHYFNADKRLNSATSTKHKPLWRDRNHFQRIWEWFMDAGLENDPPKDYCSFNRRMIVTVVGLLLASACTVLGAYKGIEALVWFLMLFALVVVSCVGLVPFMMLCVRHLLRILRKFPRDGEIGA
jgi:amino acid transporter